VIVGHFARDIIVYVYVLLKQQEIPTLFRITLTLEVAYL